MHCQKGFIKVKNKQTTTKQIDDERSIEEEDEDEDDDDDDKTITVVNIRMNTYRENHRHFLMAH